MALNLRSARYALGSALAGAVTASLFWSAPTALADAPPNCTAADMAGVAAGVSAATSAYLFTHPDLNEFVTNLKGQPRDQVMGDVQQYLEARPQMMAEIRAIRQPLADLRNRCGIGMDMAPSDMPMAQS